MRVLKQKVGITARVDDFWDSGGSRSHGLGGLVGLALRGTDVGAYVMTLAFSVRVCVCVRAHMFYRCF